MSEETSSDSASPDAVEEPKQARAKSAGAKPKPVIEHNAVFGTGDADPIRYSSAQPSPQRRVLTVLHIQRRLEAEGYAEAASAPGGTYEALTRIAVGAWQESRGEDATGILTRAQFADLFDGDPNVTLDFDTVADHAV